MCVAAAALQGAGGAAVSVVRADPRTGRLVRTTVRTQPAAAAVPSAPLNETVDRIARQNSLSPSLVHSVIQVESNYNPKAISPKGAQGLMQLIPSTARRFGVSDAFDPADNIQGGARYLKYLLSLYKGDESLALAAYNAGEGAVSRYGGVPPYPETQDYVAKVRQRLAVTGAAPSAVQIQNTPAENATGITPAEVYNPIREVKDANGRIFYTSR
jgi:soluble lytic murein transglycosylase-like protein